MSHRVGGQHQQAARLFNYQQQQIENVAAAAYYNHQMQQNIAMFMHAMAANTGGALQQGELVPYNSTYVVGEYTG